MCLGIPVEIIKIKKNNKAICFYLGVEREVDIRFTPGVREKEFVLLHAGFTIQVVDNQRVKETFDILREIDEEVN
ncbi:MAG: HypC/HybG/HupF family hydrogenase formation chaperone [Candidatus Saelkia tenebricola]|nr:HypC/HybG/HupF family hydrogenase formation chaperone [Candidatus Saelkia tenebricola]